jgi:hypothetical protein
MRRLVPILLLGLLAARDASGKELASRIERLPLEPAVVVTEEAAGATALERYRGRTPGGLPADKPLVLLVKGRELSSADTITVTKAERKGRAITVEF